MSRYSCYQRKGEVTKREILASIVIVALMIVIGLIIHGKINDNLMEDYQKYDTAIQIDNNANLFTYGMRTEIGYVFAYGDLIAVDTVSYDEIGNEYSYIKKVKERYTKHTRTVEKTRKKTDGTTEKYTEKKEYWTWDTVDSWSQHSQRISFLDAEFDYGTIPFPSSNYITTIKESSKIRYVYYGTGAKFTGTLSADFKDKTIKDTNFYVNQTIDQTIKFLESGSELIVFWFFWILLTGDCVIGFCYLDNKWLEDKKQI